MFNQLVTLVDNALEEYLKEKANPQSDIYKAMSYSVMAGGKRLRPMLMLLACKMLDGDIKSCLPFACAMEMIHTYSLIHDDLPAMDNDDLRRGKPTCHVVFGEAMAILAGDALLNYAFEISTEKSDFEAMKQLKIIRELAVSAGSEGMIGGQVVDLQSEGKSIDGEMLKYIHKKKTGAIICASCTIGAIAADATDDELQHIKSFAENLGIAFQIRDDILDVTGTEAQLGKPIGSDQESEKNTYVAIYGLEKSQELCKKYSDNAKAELQFFGSRSAELMALSDKLLYRNS